MNKNWEYKKIGEIAEKVGMGPFGSSIKVETFVPEGIPIVSGQHLHGLRLEEDVGFNFIAKEHADKLKNANLYPGDVVFTHAGNIGNVAYIPENSKYKRYIASQRQFFLRCDLSKALPSFVTYYFKTAEGQHKLKANSSSVGVPSIAQPVSYIKKVEIPVPPLPVQRKIVSILGALDDKIELNRRMNKTLEEIAQTFFHFRLLDNPDQLVPFTDFIEVNPSRQLKKGVLAPYLEMSNLPTKGHRAINWFNRPYSSGVRFINGDTIFARITPCLENGKTAFVDFLENSQIGWGSTEYIIFRPKEPIPVEIGYFLARSEIVRKHAIQNMTGTSGRQRTPASCFDNLRIPPINIDRISQLGDFIQKIMELMKSNDEQSHTLVTLRDLLIPRLLSGDL